jgi:hypothetical protein
MFEIEIDGTVYEFNFGMGFLRDINRKVKMPVDGAPKLEKNVGLRMMIADLYDGSVEALCDVLDSANKGNKPRLTQAQLDAYIDDENTDIDELFNTVMDFLSKANCSRKTMDLMKDLVEQAKQKGIATV